MHGRHLHWRLVLPFAILLLATVACGGFQLRGAVPTPTAADVPADLEDAAPAEGAGEAPESVPTAEPTAAPSPTAAPAGLAPGATARVSAASLNVRQEATTGAASVGKLTAETTVTIQGGPVEADGHTWWQIDNGAGLSGWAAAGPADAPYLVPVAGSEPVPTPSGPRLVDRPIQIGDRVRVTTEEGKVLTVRADAGVDYEAKARILSGEDLTILDGPVQQNGLIWWQVQGTELEGWAAEGQGEDRWLTPVEE